MSNDTNPVVESYLEMMIAERGATRNTVEAYSSDLFTFAQYLGRKNKTLLNASADTIKIYLGSLADSGRSSSTTT